MALGQTVAAVCSLATTVAFNVPDPPPDYQPGDEWSFIYNAR
jgi:hypothetical protein